MAGNPQLFLTDYMPATYSFPGMETGVQATLWYVLCSSGTGSLLPARLAPLDSAPRLAKMPIFYRTLVSRKRSSKMSIVVTKPRQRNELPANTVDWSDEQLLLQYRNSGDQSLFSELVHRYERELYTYLRRYLGDADQAADAFQATFLQLHLKCDQYEEGRPLRPWLYMIATNKAIDLQRRNKRHQMASLDRQGGAGDPDGKLLDIVEGGEPSPVSELAKGERGAWVVEQITNLPEHLKSVVHLVYYQGLKYREAADVLSIPVGTVKSRLHAAIRSLTESWNETFNDLEEF